MTIIRGKRSGFVFLALVLALTLAVTGSAAQDKGDKKDDAKDKKEEKKKKEGLPLEPTRTIEFTTDEATWLSLDVSPDGQTLVFELLGDLYTLPLDGGQATRISAGMAFDSQPRFSPDGRRIAFLSDRDGAENLWIMQADGTEPKQLSKDKTSSFASPTWMPTGDYVIVSRVAKGLATFELWMYHVKGGRGVQITKAKRGSNPNPPRSQRHNAVGAVVSPDGNYLYYARRIGGFQYNARFPLWQIARRNMTTGVEDIITQNLGSAIRPLLSPDGEWLVYGTRYEAQTGLRLRNLETGEDRWLIYPVQRDDQEARFTRDLLPGYAFTPDGREVIVTFGGKINRVNVASGQAQVIPFSAQVKQGLGPQLNFPRRVEDGPIRARLIQKPAQSPDGQRLAFSALTRLYLMDLPEGKPRQIDTAGERAFHPAWSPDGRWIAYVTWSTDGGHIWKTRADGSGRPQRLTSVAAFYSDPAWAPDGERLVALRASAYDHLYSPVDFGQTPGMDLIWIPAAGGDARLVIPSRGLGSPHFTRENDRIYLYTSGNFRTGKGSGLISFRFDGTDRRTHMQVTGPGFYFSEQPVGADNMRMSPDGRWVLAYVGNQLYLAAAPQIGGGPTKVNVNSPSVPIKKLTDIGADYFEWADNGQTITWAIGSTFFRRPLDSISFEEKKDKEESKEAEEAEEVEEANESKGSEASESHPENEEEEPSPVEEIEVVVEVPRHMPAGTLVLRGARVITMKGDEVIENADIVVTDNRLAALGRRGRVRLPRGARVLDVSGMTIVPGFIDTHAHWFEIRRGVLDTQNWSFLANVAYGVTAGLDVQTASNDMFAYQDLADAGEIIGLRAFSTGPGVFSDNAFKSKDEAVGVLKRYKKHYRTHNIKSYLVGNRKQRQFVVQAAHELEIMPTTEGALDLKLDMTHALDGFNGNEHALPIVPLYKDVFELFAQSGIGYTPTLLVAYGGPFAENDFYTSTEVHDNQKLARFTPHNVLDQKTKRRPWFRRDQHVYPKIAAQAAKIIRAGGRVGVGSHGQLQGLGYHWEMWALASGGLTPLETLRCATLHGAEIIGVAQDLGSLEKGKLADLVILEKNPLDDIHNTDTIRYVMKNGELFEGDTLKQVWPVEKELEALWWWDEGPDARRLSAND